MLPCSVAGSGCFSSLKIRPRTTQSTAKPAITVPITMVIAIPKLAARSPLKNAPVGMVPPS